MKRFAVGALALAIFAAVWFLGLQLTTPDVSVTAISTPHSPTASPLPKTDSSPSTRSRDTAATAKSIPLERLDLAKELNATSKTIRDDLQLLDSVFSVWQSNFLKEGNPVGENVEITAALAGKNTLHVAFIAPNHPAINAKGELCDRWGTPFFFHQESAAKMGICSAGPDHRRGTPDDVVFTR